MTHLLTRKKEIGEFSLWEKMEAERGCLAFTLEVTARCNNNCRHCYINVPADNAQACLEELSTDRLLDIADQAVRLGAVWCTMTGGEPLLRPDFAEVYLGLKKKGLLVSVMTNATLLNQSHVDLFLRFPPRDIEITVYGVTKETYESVSRCPGSFDAFMRGLTLLENAGIKFRLKAMAIRSNLHEIKEITKFCRAHTKDYYRFDPLLHLRMDRDPERNEEVRRERLTPEEVVSLEKTDEERVRALEKNCHVYINPEFSQITGDILLSCGAGGSNFAVSPNGMFRLCESLCHPDCVYDLKHGALAEAWQDFIPSVRAMRSRRKEFLATCRVCPIINLCMWCPAHADLETGELDGPVDYFCRVAHERARALGYKK
jgi:radical SAM protein with 4Fe4S-binding SPASM domain